MSEIKFEMGNTEDKEEHLESAKEFYELLIPYLNAMETIVEQLREAKSKIESVL